MSIDKKKYGFTPDYAIPPGETLKETMESLGMTQRDLATRTGLTVQSLNRIFKGEQPINYETAAKLELVTRVPATFWNSMEYQYREQLEKVRELEILNKSLDWLKTIPVSELQTRKLIAPSKEKNEQLREVLKFFGVSSVSAWKEIWTKPKVAARRSSCFESVPGYAATWVREGEIRAQQIECRPFDKKLFKEALIEIRKLTIESPGVFVDRMIELCADAGVAVAFVPEMKKVPWSGATKWMNANKALIIINLRGKREDKFWFSFFHEAGHVVHDNKKHLYINDDGDDPIEQRADKFAESILFPDKKSRAHIPMLTSKRNIIAYAKELGLSPGIVAGQYQHLTGRWRYYNDLITKFLWA